MLAQVKFEGQTGHVEFNDEGHRTNFVINVLEQTVDSDVRKVWHKKNTSQHTYDETHWNIAETVAETVAATISACVTSHSDEWFHMFIVRLID